MLGGRCPRRWSGAGCPFVELQANQDPTNDKDEDKEYANKYQPRLQSIPWDWIGSDWLCESTMREPST